MEQILQITATEPNQEIVFGEGGRKCGLSMQSLLLKKETILHKIYKEKLYYFLKNRSITTVVR